MTSEWALEGEYAEACNCEVVCQCVWLEPPDGDVCTAALAWNVVDGHADDVDLSGRRVAMLVASDEGVMFDPTTQWDVVLLIDDEATDEERGAIEDIYCGRAGGIWSPVADTHFRSVEVTTAPVEFVQEGGTTTVAFGDAMAMEVVEKVGFNDEPGTVYPHPLTADLTMKTAKSNAALVSHDDQFTWDVGGKNAFVCEFELTNA